VQGASVQSQPSAAEAKLKAWTVPLRVATACQAMPSSVVRRMRVALAPALVATRPTPGVGKAMAP
jgi:hypothetical protein